MAYKYIDKDTKRVICFPNLRDDCIPQETVIRDVRLAAAYVPYQRLCTLLSPINALKAGTIFPELFSPYKRKEYYDCRPARSNSEMERKGR